jgi:hypothetical protein
MFDQQFKSDIEQQVSEAIASNVPSTSVSISSDDVSQALRTKRVVLTSSAINIIFMVDFC